MTPGAHALCTIRYTSGTTGEPKSVMFSFSQPPTLARLKRRDALSLWPAQDFFVLTFKKYVYNPVIVKNRPIITLVFVRLWRHFAENSVTLQSTIYHHIKR